MPVHLAVIMINVFWSIQALRAQDNYAPTWPALNVSTYLVRRCQDKTELLGDQGPHSTTGWCTYW